MVIKKHEHPLSPCDPYKIYKKWGGQWKCDGCGLGNSSTDIMFHCNICNYDLCSTCFYFIYPSYPDHPHTLRLTSKRGGDCAPEWKCSCCEKDVEFAYSCKECDESFLVCKSCFNGIYAPDLHEHRVVLADSKKVYPKFRGNWHCDICGEGGKKASQMFHCFECGNIDICSDCLFEDIEI